MIEIRKLCAGYEGKEVLKQVDMKFELGKITVLIGPNGCGKSTLLKTIVRIHERSSGDVLLNDVSMDTMNTSQVARQVSYLPQNKKAPDMSVLRMVLHGRFAYLGYPRKYRPEDIEMAKKAIAWAGLEGMEEEQVSHLSGGMQQKVYIAMALTQDTETILMDEPTTYLDIAYQLRLMSMAKSLAEKGKAVVMVLHDLSQALRVADKVIVIDNGEVVKVGTAEEVYESGILPKVFGVGLERVLTKSGWHYSAYET